MKLKIRQHYHFNQNSNRVGSSLLSSVSWDVLRTDENDTPFSMPKNRDAWIAKATRDGEIAARASAVINLCRELSISRITSSGVGGAWLEYNIKRSSPDIHITVCDYAPEAVLRLKALFTECDVVQEFNMLGAQWFNWQDLHLLHRVDTEFTDKQWRTIFINMAKSGIDRTLFIPSEFLTWHTILDHKKRFLKDLIKRRKSTFCGWLRNEEAFHNLYPPAYELEREIVVGNLTGFLLRREMHNK